MKRKKRDINEILTEMNDLNEIKHLPEWSQVGQLLEIDLD